MERIRTAYITLIAILLMAGYLASQAAFFGGTAYEWSQRVDQPSVQLLLLLLVVGAAILGLRSSREEQQ